MIQWILMTLLFIFNFIFMNLTHPLAMGLLLITQTMLISIMSGLMTKSFWFAYILFLIFMGGMLVLFIYVTSLASNEMFSLSIKLILTSLIMMSLSTLMMILLKKKFLPLYETMETQTILNMNSFLTENSLITNKLYNYPTNLLTILLMNYLLVTLIAIIKITKLHKGPLRTMFN